MDPFGPGHEILEVAFDLCIEAAKKLRMLAGAKKRLAVEKSALVEEEDRQPHKTRAVTTENKKRAKFVTLASSKQEVNQERFDQMVID